MGEIGEATLIVPKSEMGGRRTMRMVCMRKERRYIAFALQRAAWLLGERWLKGEKEGSSDDVGVNW